MSRKVTLGHDMSGYISLLQVNSSLFRLGLVSSGEVSLCQVISGYVRLGKIMSV
jgi:hypothetical protein